MTINHKGNNRKKSLPLKIDAKAKKNTVKKETDIDRDAIQIFAHSDTGLNEREKCGDRCHCTEEHSVLFCFVCFSFWLRFNYGVEYKY